MSSLRREILLNGEIERHATAKDFSVIEGAAMERETCNQQSDENLSNTLQQGSSSGSTNMVATAEAETILVIKPDQVDIPQTEISETNYMPVKEEKVPMDALESGKHDCPIDKCHSRSSSSENFNREKVCRICQLSAEQFSEATNLIQLGCSCKGDLSISHRRCAKVWFKRKGNRQCEICGETAKNVMVGIEESPFRVEYRNDTRMIGAYSLERETPSCSWRQSFCNFLVACVVLAFIILWFFRVDVHLSRASQDPGACYKKIILFCNP